MILECFSCRISGKEVFVVGMLNVFDAMLKLLVQSDEEVVTLEKKRFRLCPLVIKYGCIGRFVYCFFIDLWFGH